MKLLGSMAILNNYQLTDEWPFCIEIINDAFSQVNNFSLDKNIVLRYEAQWSIVNTACNLAVINQRILSFELSKLLNYIESTRP